MATKQITISVDGETYAEIQKEAELGGSEVKEAVVSLVKTGITRLNALRKYASKNKKTSAKKEKAPKAAAKAPAAKKAATKVAAKAPAAKKVAEKTATKTAAKPVAVKTDRKEQLKAAAKRVTTFAPSKKAPAAVPAPEVEEAEEAQAAAG